MLFNLLGDISGRRRRKKELCLAEERLLALLDDKGVVDIGTELAARLGIGHKTLKQAAFSLALKESLQMLSNSKSALRVMTNSVYEEYMSARSRTRETEIRPLAEPIEEAVCEIINPGVGMSFSMEEMESSVFATGTLRDAPHYPDYEWFAIDVAPPEAEAENVADNDGLEDGKNLPPREREPWANCQGVGLD